MNDNATTDSEVIDMDADTLWQATWNNLQCCLTPGSLTYLKDLSVVAYDGVTLTLGIVNADDKELIESRWLPTLQRAVKNVLVTKSAFTSISCLKTLRHHLFNLMNRIGKG